ncbi:TIM-barrel domain-containing protein [Lactococcus lactis]|uniref:glycoside hydrolase family 31 protein n=1 Tax=Lactococcus lactis TaxID=1358 RepID=UPI0022E19FEE|nr:TIM-barrel domain-containing protein [Lactococcus lactis]WNN67776.1 glycoside hydrolase family 31 protein [Lactococcus lactis]WPK09479.1 glycoside hydrolase family 31 protein [Lactococcus lactis]
MEKIILKPNETRAFNFREDTALINYNETGELRIDIEYSAAFGGGERYHIVNIKGHRINIEVEEKFCEQFDKSYCPMPFFLTNNGFGLYVNTGQPINFAFEDDFILANVPLGTEITLFSGTTEEIISDYMSLFGHPVLPPEYAFLPWISANHWDTQEKVEQQIELLKQYDFPAGVIVLEAWSDEATFYIFNGAKYDAKSEGYLKYEDFSFPEDGPWSNPKAMIEKLHKAGLKVMLWQIPVYKKQDSSETISSQNEIDRQKAVENGLCVHQEDGTPYTIPTGNWFSGSMIPDFTNEDTKKDWFAKRQYLLDIGVDGFKTDGGEFIYRDDLVFANGMSGAEMKNHYPQSYTAAYTEFLSENHILFSRAGFSGQHTTPILWAGDQKSTFSELRSQLRAGLSAAMSGIVFWGYDIAGFAGPIPDSDLYLRATQMATFCPVMQWHSEPDGGQFSAIMASEDLENERSPWNIAKRSGDEKLLERTRFYHKLREKLLSHIVSEAQKSVENNRPLMVPFAYDYMNDKITHDITDEFIFASDFLVAPIITANTYSRDVYLPEGCWENYWTKEKFDGKQWVHFEHEWHIPVYQKIAE